MLTSASQHPILSRFATAVVCMAVLAALASCGYGAYVWWRGSETLGVGFVAAGVLALLLSVLAYCQVMLLHKLVSNSYRTYEAVLDAGEFLRRQIDYTRTIAENTSLSDWAKKIVYREKDYEFLHDTIQGAIVRQEWEAAEHLIRELAEEFGYRAEAERLRQALTAARKATLEEKVAAAVERFETLCAARKWAQARDETRRLLKLFPHAPPIAALPRELDLRRRQFKNQLLKEYDEAVRTHEVDRAHDLLVELDTYLAPNEAAALKESARGVFKAKLLQMGVQFSLNVSDRNFRGALEVGAQIMREYPNSRFAREIGQMMPVLRKRAAQEDRPHAPAATA